MTTPEDQLGQGGAVGRVSAVLELLKRVPIRQFRGPQELGAVAFRTSLSPHEHGNIIFNKEDPGSTHQVIADGSVKIYMPAEGGEEVPLAMLKAGDFFGELALLDGGSRAASAMALAHTAILIVERDQFRRFITSHTGRAAAVFQALAALMRKQNAQLFGEYFES